MTISANANAVAPIRGDDEQTLRVQLTDFLSCRRLSRLDRNDLQSYFGPHPRTRASLSRQSDGTQFLRGHADNLIKVDVTGISSNRPPIAATRPDLRCTVSFMHRARMSVAWRIRTRPRSSAIALKQDGFDYDNFYGAQLFGRVAFHDFEGITLYPDERSRMLASIGDRHVLVLRNHASRCANGIFRPPSPCCGWCSGRRKSMPGRRTARKAGALVRRGPAALRRRGRRPDGKTPIWRTRFLRPSFAGCAWRATIRPGARVRFDGVGRRPNQLPVLKVAIAD